MGYLELIRLRDVKPKSPILIQGVPGLGLVGKLAANYLIRKLDAVKVVEIYSDYLPLPDGSAGVRVEGDEIRPPTYDIFYIEGRADVEIFVLTSDVQPITFGQYKIGELVLDYAQEMGVDTVLTMGGYIPGTPDVKGVFACTNNEEFMSRLEKLGVNRLEGGYVTGAAGLLVGLADLRGLTASCLLGTTSGPLPDPRASKMVLTVLSDLYNIDIDLEELEKEAEVSEAMIREELRVMEPTEYRPEEEESRGLPYHG